MKKKDSGLMHFKRKGLFDSGLLSKHSLQHLKDISKRAICLKSNH